MQAGCRSRYSIALLRIHRLIPIMVERLVCAFDVGRQRDVPQAIQRFVEAVFRTEANSANAILSAPFDTAFQFAFPEDDCLSDANFPPGTNKRFPGIRRELWDEETFDGRR